MEDILKYWRGRFSYETEHGSESYCLGSNPSSTVPKAITRGFLFFGNSCVWTGESEGTNAYGSDGSVASPPPAKSLSCDSGAQRPRAMYQSIDSRKNSTLTFSVKAIS